MKKIQKSFASISLTLIFLFFLNGNTFSQVFNWYDDGFIYPIEFYPNIDNSGIDIEITGIVGGSWQDNSVGTGVNGNGNNGVQHEYKFKFSETVDLEFEITGINRDTTGSMCYNDQLIFVNHTAILYSSNVNIIGDTVFALWGGLPFTGQVRVRYENVDSLTVYHGEGTGCDPGSIRISPLIINDNFLSTNNLSQMDLELIQLNSSQLLVKNLLKLPKQVKVFNTLGQEIPSSTALNNGLLIDIELSNPGFYFVFIELDNGAVARRKIYINH
jgi:hypothetical protein